MRAAYPHAPGTPTESLAVLIANWLAGIVDSEARVSSHPVTSSSGCIPVIDTPHRSSPATFRQVIPCQWPSSSTITQKSRVAWIWAGCPFLCTKTGLPLALYKGGRTSTSGIKTWSCLKTKSASSSPRAIPFESARSVRQCAYWPSSTGSNRWTSVPTSIGPLPKFTACWSSLLTSPANPATPASPSGGARARTSPRASSSGFSSGPVGSFLPSFRFSRAFCFFTFFLLWESFWWDLGAPEPVATPACRISALKSLSSCLARTFIASSNACPPSRGSTSISGPGSRVRSSLPWSLRCLAALSRARWSLRALQIPTPAWISACNLALVRIGSDVLGATGLKRSRRAISSSRFALYMFSALDTRHARSLSSCRATIAPSRLAWRSSASCSKRPKRPDLSSLCAPWSRMHWWRDSQLAASALEQQDLRRPQVEPLAPPGRWLVLNLHLCHRVILYHTFSCDGLDDLDLILSAGIPVAILATCLLFWFVALFNLGSKGQLPGVFVAAPP